MKLKSKFKLAGLAFAISLMGFGCTQENQRDANEVVDETQAEMNDAGAEVSREYNEFSTWVNTKTERADNVTAEEYREMRAEYRRREAELERESSTWDDETRRAWKKTKADWNDFENKVQRRLGNIEDVDVDVDVKKNNR
jgi:hypothetical protein